MLGIAILAVVTVRLDAVSPVAPPNQAATSDLPASVTDQATSSASVPAEPEHPLIAAIKRPHDFVRSRDVFNLVENHRNALDTIRDQDGRSALHWAVERGHQDFTYLLLQRGAPVNATDSLGRTPLFAAISGRHTWLTFLLLLAGAEGNHVAEDGTTPLALAVEGDDFRHAEILLWTGANPLREGIPEEKSPLRIAEQSGKDGMQALLNDYANLQNSAGLVSQSVVPTFVRNPIHAAAARGDFPALDALLGSRHDVHTRDERGRTPIFDAISAGQPEVVFYLLAIGSDPNTLDNEGRSALSATMGWLGGGLDAMRHFLLVKGASPNTLRKDGHSELTWAVKRDNEHGVQLLLWTTIDPRQTTRHGTAFEVAVHEGNQRIIDLLRRNGIDGETRLSDDPQWLLINGARRGDLLLIDEALANGASVDTLDPRGDPALLVAIYKRNVPAARHLISKGADINLPSRHNGVTAIFGTVVWDYPEMTTFREELLAAVADPDVAEWKSGITPLMRAVWHHPTKPLKQLVAAGADLNARDSRGRTALTRAIDENKLETAEYLRQKGAAE